MKIEITVAIEGSKTAVWKKITDIENAADTIGGIDKVEVLENPGDGLVGLRWRETRTMLGKTATEEMWIIDAAENEFYQTRAESHGCVYLTTMSVAGDGEKSSLTMSHQIKPQVFVAKIMAPLMGFVFKRTIRKVILQDLNDIKASVEGQGRESPE